MVGMIADINRSACATSVHPNVPENVVWPLEASEEARVTAVTSLGRIGPPRSQDVMAPSLGRAKYGSVTAAKRTEAVRGVGAA